MIAKITAIFSIDALISYLIIDFSGDGVTYHDAAINFISTNRYQWFGITDGDLRIAAYPIGGWVLPALYRDLLDFSLINSGGKLIAIGITATLIHELTESQKNRTVRFITIALFSLAPITISQFFTGYLDWWTYYLTTWFLAAIQKIDRDESNFFLCIIIASLALLIKIQACVIIFIVSLAYLSANIVSKNTGIYIKILRLMGRRKIAGCLCISFFFTCLFIVYGKNLIVFGSVSPIASKMGAGKILFDNTFYQNNPWYTHLIYSLFSVVELNSENPALKIIPWNLPKTYVLVYPDVRFGAHGALAGILYITSMIVCLINKNRSNFLTIFFSDYS